MQSSPFRRSRTGLWFAAFTITSLLLLLASQTDAALTLQRVSARALAPVRQAIGGIGDGLAGIFGTIGEIDRLRTENDDLRRRLAGAEQRIAELAEAAAENEDLRSLLGLTQSLDMDLLPVRVITRDPSNFTWEVGIDAGTDDGVQQGMPVVGSAEGAGALAGTVVSAGPDTAIVRLIVDTRSSVVAVDQRSRALGLVQGQLGGQLVMVQVNVTDTIEVGDAIVSAGLVLDGGAIRSPYPKGLLIGQVQALQRDSNALTQTAFVRPALAPPGHRSRSCARGRMAPWSDADADHRGMCRDGLAPYGAGWTPTAARACGVREATSRGPTIARPSPRHPCRRPEPRAHRRIRAHHAAAGRGSRRKGGDHRRADRPADGLVPHLRGRDRGHRRGGRGDGRQGLFAERHLAGGPGRDQRRQRDHLSRPRQRLPESLHHLVPRRREHDEPGLREHRPRERLGRQQGRRRRWWRG